jgi:hypothetical protein
MGQINLSFWSLFLAFSAVIGTIAGITRILEYFGVKPRGVTVLSFSTSTKIVAICMLLTWLGVAFDYYDRYRSLFPIWPKPYSPIAVVGKTFRNEKVPLDGYSYSNCVFDNVKLIYNGTTAAQINNSKVTGALVISSDNMAVEGVMLLLGGIGYLKPGVDLSHMPPGNKVEPLQSPKEGQF